MSRTESEMFILTAEAEDSNGGCRLLFWCIGLEGPALIRIHDHRPIFFIEGSRSAGKAAGHARGRPDSAGDGEAGDGELPAGIRCERRSLALAGLEGIPVDGLYFRTLEDYREARLRLSEMGIRMWESDVRPEDRYLMERFIAGSVRVRGAMHREGGLRIFDNPGLSPSDWRPGLSTLSLNIETGRDGTLYGIALDYADGTNRFRRAAVLDPAAARAPGGTFNLSSGAARGAGGAVRGQLIQEQASEENPPPLYLPSEAGLIHFLIEGIRELDPDVIIGWHVVGFDLVFLRDRSRRLGIPLAIGRGSAPLRIAERRGSLPIADLQGRLVIDGPPALRGAHFKFSDWRLDTVGHELMGRRKEISARGTEKVEEIERRYREDKAAPARCNLDDAVLVTEIFRRTGVLEQLVTRSLITGLPVDQVHRSVAAFDRFFLPRLHRKGYAAPDRADVVAGEAAPGALVFTDGAGLFEDVAVLDFKSLYPTLMRTFHIDPYSLVQGENDPLSTPVDVSFSLSEHILPGYIAELLERRAEAKRRGDAPLAQAIKILMNAMYGVMGSSGCRFYRPELPSAVTGIGRWVLESTSARLKAWGYQVLYGDTDSVFVKLKTEERQDADAAGRRLAHRVDEWFREIIRERYGVPSYLELEFEKRYVRLFLPEMRGAGKGAVKRYAGMLPGGEVEIKGMEFVRSDSTPMAREFQYELFRRCFTGEVLAPWIRETVRRLRAGEFDDKLIYRRRLSRRASEYKSPPPHVKAVKLLDPDGKKDLREVNYVITPGGPVPMQLDPRDIDYNHYIEKQLRPLADDILSLRNESFDGIIGGRQLELFAF